jgi:hypothetical protein
MLEGLRRFLVLGLGGVIPLVALAQQPPDTGQAPSSLPGVVSKAEPSKADPETMLKCQQLSGFAKLKESFTIERASQGYINRFDESILTVLRTDRGKILNAAWWFNPIVRGKPQYDWYVFLDLFGHVDALLVRHTWLAEWINAGGGRLLELHAFGREPESEPDDIKSNVLPIWREAGFVGKPEYEVLARLGDTSWIEMFFNDKDERLLLNYSMDLSATPVHWLDALDVQFHPKCKKGERSSRYAIVDPTGHWQVREYGKCATAEDSPCQAEVREASNTECLLIVRLSGDCSSPDAVHAERVWLSQHYPGWVLLSQALTSSLVGQPPKVEDQLHIRTGEGKELGLCFDITDFWP